ncbi:unnamed protein product, partial [Prorocentrum cordatum]
HPLSQRGCLRSRAHAGRPRLRVSWRARLPSAAGLTRCPESWPASRTRACPRRRPPAGSWGPPPPSQR